MSRDLLPAGLARKKGDPINAKGGARPASRAGRAWEDYVLGLDQDLDQFRHTFREQRPAQAEPNARDKAASRLNPLRPTDEILSSRPAGGVSATSEIVNDAPPSTGFVPQGDVWPAHSPDPEETKPIDVSLSGVVLVLAAGCAWIRGQWRKRRDGSRRGFNASHSTGRRGVASGYSFPNLL
jgi:hypothetical protein